VKLTLKIKLLPDKEQEKALLDTIKEANDACNCISKVAWNTRIFNQYKLHKQAYYLIKGGFNLSSQMIARCLSKVSDAYKIDKKTRREFKPLGGIAYDSRILSYKEMAVSIWTVEGRLKWIPFVCHNTKYLPYIKGEADLVYKEGKFFLFQVVDIPDAEIKDIEEFIGVDFGLTDIVVTSDGIKHSAEWINKYREKKQKIRSSIQTKADTSKRSTKRSCRRLLKRLTGRERTTATIINHTISKSIVSSAKSQDKGIAIEDLTNIRFTSKRRNKKFKTKLGRWSFAQLRSFLEYKSLLNGVKLVVVNPRYTSQSCYVCHHIGERKNKSFKCTNCGLDTDADLNGSKNIALLGDAVNHPEKSTMYCSLHI
jgi:putative transposase